MFDPFGARDGEIIEVGSVAELVVAIGEGRKEERDDELFEPTPSSLSLLPPHDDPLLEIKEGSPVVWVTNIDDLEKVGEGEESYGFGDGEEGGEGRSGERRRFAPTC